MKIFAYGIRPDEHAALANWKAAHPDVEVAYTDQLLTEATAALAQGADAVNTLQVAPYTGAALDALAELGITKLSLRNVGTENIDREAIVKHNFRVSNVPQYSPNAIAEHAAIQLARLLRQTKPLDAKIAQGDLRWAPTIGREVRTQTVGVIGTGHIGSVLIDILQGFGAKVIAYGGRTRPARFVEQGLYVETLDELYAQADVISLNIPGTPTNHHLIDATALAKMKPGVQIVNVSRGNLIDTAALLAALDTGHVGGAVLDVYEHEVGLFNVDWTGQEIPDAQLRDLMQRENVLVTPHTAFYTTKAVAEMVGQSLDASLAFIEGRETDLELSLES